MIRPVFLIVIFMVAGSNACELETRNASELASPFPFACNSALDPRANEEIVAGKIYRVRSRASIYSVIKLAPLDTPIYVIRSEAKKIVLFSMGNGDGSRGNGLSDLKTYFVPPYSAFGGAQKMLGWDAAYDSETDAENIRRVIEGGPCLGMGKLKDLDITIVIPHAHADHVNAELVPALQRRGAREVRLIYHHADHEALHCTTPYCGYWKPGMAEDLKRKMPAALFGVAPFNPSLSAIPSAMKQVMEEGDCATPLLSLPYDGSPGGLQIFQASSEALAVEEGVPWLPGGPFHTPGTLNVYLPNERRFDTSDECEGLRCRGVLLLGGNPSQLNCFRPSDPALPHRRGANGDRPRAPYFDARAFGQHLFHDTEVK